MRWCREMLALSPFSLRLLKASFNAAEDGLAGHPAAGARRQPPLLRQRGGAGGPRRLQGEAPAGLRQVPPAALSPRRASWLRGRRGRARCPAAVAPVLVGTALAVAEDEFRPLAFAAALVGSVFIQIGTNLSNDYSDARRGADTEDRLGPVRVTAGGLMPPRRVLVGHLRGVRRSRWPRAPTWRRWRAGSCWWWARRRSWPACSTPAGRAPTATRGWASCSCSCSSAWWRWPARTSCRPRSSRWEAFALSVPVGLLAAAILVVNNVRDVDTDRRAGKRTLAVQARARARARGCSRRCCVVAFARAGRRMPLAGRAVAGGCCSPLASLPLAPPLVRTVRTRTDGPALNARAGRHRAAAGRLLAAAVRRACCCREALAAAALDPAPRAVRDRRRGGGGARAGWCCGSRTTTARWATARRRRSSPTTACALDEVVDALRDGPPARGAPPQARAA